MKRTLKKLSSLLLALCMILSLLPMTALAVEPPLPVSGTDWSLSNTGLLTITSDAGMTDWLTNLDGGFTYSDYVTSVSIGGTVTTISNNAFQNRTNITNVTFGDSVTAIGDSAFLGLTGLTGLTIPASVTSIGDNAFSGCGNLINVVFLGDDPSKLTIGSDIFTGCDALNGVYVPAAALSEYKTTFSAYESLFHAPNVAIIKSGTTTYYPTLSDALEKAADGDTITLLDNITEEASNKKSSAATVTIDGGGFTVTGSDLTNSVALTLVGTDTVILKNLTLQGGAASTSSTGLKVGDPVSVQSYGTVTVNGFGADYSYGLDNSSTGTVDVTVASASGNFIGAGVANQGLGTVNVGTATGNGLQGIGAANTNKGTINVTEATGSNCGVNNQSTGTVNVTTATGVFFGVYNVSTGTINATTITSSDVAVKNDSNGKVNAGTISNGTFTTTTNMDVAAVTLNKGTGASCVLDSITVAKTGSTTVGTLPSVASGGTYSNTWYTDSAKTIAFSGTTVTGAATLYSYFYIPDTTISIPAISGITVPVSGAVPTSAIADTTQYTAIISWSPAATTFAAGTVYTATITLTPKTGYTLTGVPANFFTVAGATTTNAANSGVVTAVFPATAAASSVVDSGSTSGGSSGSGSTTSSSTVTTTTTGSGRNAVTTASTSISGNTSVGAQTVTVPKDAMSNLTKAAKKAESSGAKAVASIDTGTGKSLTNVDITIPGTQFAAFASGTDAELQFATGIGSVTFTSGAVDTIAAVGFGNVAFSIGTVDKFTLSTDEQNLVGTRPVYSFSVTVGNTKVSEFGSSVMVSLPYTLGTGEDPNAIVIYYLDASGNLQIMPGKYDAATNSVTFTTNHFSNYVIGYNKVDFTDVSPSAWYADAVTFLAARGVTSGTTESTFSPDATLTRGQFITMLLRAFGISPDTNPTDNFSDAGNTYYTNYLAAAKRLGISGGVGTNLFAPEKEITRQEMFTLLYNALKVIDALPTGTSGKMLSDFSDASDVASWAKDAMGFLVETGTVSGSDGKLNSTGTTTRAEVAQVLYNLLSAEN